MRVLIGDLLELPDALASPLKLTNCTLTRIPSAIKFGGNNRDGFHVARNQGVGADVFRNPTVRFAYDD